MKASIDTAAGATLEEQHPLAPPRLLAGGGSELERMLLASAGADRIAPASRQQLERALTGTGTLAPAGGAGRMALVSHVVKYGAAAGLGALALWGAWAAREHAPPRARGAPAVVAEARPEERAGGDPTPRAVPPPPVQAPQALERATAAEVARAPESGDARRVLRAAPSKRGAASELGASDVTHAAPAAATAAGGLGEELRLLESAARALRAGRTGDAERALDEHARRFNGGELELESELLRADVALARGDRAQVKARAQRLRARPAAARYRARLEALERAADERDSSSNGANPKSPHMDERR